MKWVNKIFWSSVEWAVFIVILIPLALVTIWSLKRDQKKFDGEE